MILDFRDVFISMQSRQPPISLPSVSCVVSSVRVPVPDIPPIWLSVINLEPGRAKFDQVINPTPLDTRYSTQTRKLENIISSGEKITMTTETNRYYYVNV